MFFAKSLKRKASEKLGADFAAKIIEEINRTNNEITEMATTALKNHQPFTAAVAAQDVKGMVSMYLGICHAFSEELINESYEKFEEMAKQLQEATLISYVKASKYELQYAVRLCLDVKFMEISGLKKSEETQ